MISHNHGGPWPTSPSMWTQQLITAATSGRPIELRRSQDGSLVAVPGAAIRDALMDRRLQAHPRGLQIYGAYITGTLDLTQSDVPCPLTVIASRFEEAPLFACAQFPSLNLSETTSPGLYASELRTSRGGVALSGIDYQGRIDLSGATIEGQLLMSGARLRHDEVGPAFVLNSASVKFDVICDNLVVEGESRLDAVEVGGMLQINEARLGNGTGAALSMEHAKIHGNVLADRLQTDGTTRLSGMNVDGVLYLNNALLCCTDGFALAGDQLHVGLGMDADSLRAVGSIMMNRLEVGGMLNISNAHLEAGSDGAAFRVQWASIAGVVSAKNMQTSGELDFRGSTIGGPLLLENASLDSHGGVAMRMDNCTVGVGILGNRLETSGDFQLGGARVNGDVELNGAALANPKGQAFSARNTEIQGGFFARDVDVTGTIMMKGIRVGGAPLDLSGAHVRDSGAVALDLESAQLHSLWLRNMSHSWDGGLSLVRARIGDLVVDETHAVGGFWDNRGPAVDASGWNLEEVSGFLREDPRTFTSWLGRSNAFVAQPLMQVAAFYDRSGEPEHARTVRVAIEEIATKRVRSRAHRVLRRTLYGATVGYGYHPFRALLWILVIALLAGGTAYLWPEGFQVSENDAESGPSIRPVMVALQTILPAAALSLPYSVEPVDTLLQIWLTALRTSAWLLLALFLGGVTGLLRRRS